MEDDLTLRVNPDQENVKSVFGIEDALDEHSQSNANNEVETTKVHVLFQGFVAIIVDPRAVGHTFSLPAFLCAC